MRIGRAFLLAVLLVAVPTVSALGASVPVFQHDPVSEQAYYHEDILPHLIPLAIIVALSVLVAVVLARRARRKAHQSGGPH